MWLWSEWIDKMLEGRRVSWERPKFFKLCPIVLNYIQNIFPKSAKNFPALLVYGHAYLGANCARSLNLPFSHLSQKQWRARRGGGGGGRQPLRLETFRASSVFKTSTSCSKMLKDKEYFSTVKNFRADSVFTASASCSKFWMRKNVYIQYS